jgi:hypothetical protein
MLQTKRGRSGTSLRKAAAPSTGHSTVTVRTASETAKPGTRYAAPSPLNWMATRETVGDDELWRNKANGVAELLKFTRPVVGTGAGFHEDESGWQQGNRSSSLARGNWAYKGRLARFIPVVNRKSVLCQIDGIGYDCCRLTHPISE